MYPAKISFVRSTLKHTYSAGVTVILPITGWCINIIHTDLSVSITRIMYMYLTMICFLKLIALVRA